MPDGIGQREAISQSGKQHVPGSWQLARAGKQQGAQRRRPGRRRPERSAVHSTPATIGDGQLPKSRLIKEGRKLGNYLYTKAASSAKGEKKIGGKLNIDYFS